MSNARDGDGALGAGGERRLIGSLRDALVAAAAPSRPPQGPPIALPPPLPANEAAGDAADRSAAANAEAQPPGAAREQVHFEFDAPRTKVVRARPIPVPIPDRTQVVRGKSKPKEVAEFYQDPVVGWLVVVAGQGLGAFRPIFEGNNTIGRSPSQRIPIDFGDETISNEEQAYLRYDFADRKYLLVPNLAKTNIVAVNDRKPTGAIELNAMDLITMGRTHLAFVPFCSPEFDWSDISETKS